MFKTIQKKLTKRTLIRELERDSYKQEMNAAYNENIIEDLDKKIEEHRNEIEGFQLKIMDLKDAREYEKRDERKKLESSVDEHKKIIEGLKNMIAQVMQAASMEKQKAAQSRHRADFIRKNF